VLYEDDTEHLPLSPTSPHNVGYWQLLCQEKCSVIVIYPLARSDKITRKPLYIGFFERNFGLWRGRWERVG